MIDLGDYYCGGYLLIRADLPERWRVAADPLPDNIISLAECICPLRASVHWGWRPGDRDAALRFGIPQEKMDEFVEWCGSGFGTDIDIFSTFYSVEAARRFIARFVPNSDNLYLIGAGLHRDLPLIPYPPHQTGDELFGTEKLLSQHLPLESGGTMLGFEIASLAYNDFGHSWWCSGGLIEDVDVIFGIRPNDYGLIDSYADAKKVYEWVAVDEMQGRRSEPEPYYPWLLVSYPLETDAP
jgi:hypothetical protein